MKAIIPAALIATTVASHSATVILNNKDSAGLVTTGSQATFGAQSFVLSTAGTGTGDTVAANSPLPSTASLTSITFVKAPAGSATAGQLYVKIYTGSADATGTPIAVSTNSIDVNSATSLADLTWSFSDATLSTTTTYFAVFSTNGASDSTGTDGVGARIAGANFGSGFVNTYSGGTGYNATSPTPAAISFDSRFSVAFEVPEPSTALLGGIGILSLLRRRRA
ncbi:MAG: PEP-CTERM sorting domain-containing protein [Luteolibacter sp.]